MIRARWTKASFSFLEDAVTWPLPLQCWQPFCTIHAAPCSMNFTMLACRVLEKPPTKCQMPVKYVLCGRINKGHLSQWSVTFKECIYSWLMIFSICYSEGNNIWFVPCRGKKRKLGEIADEGLSHRACITSPEIYIIIPGILHKILF